MVSGNALRLYCLGRVQSIGCKHAVWKPTLIMSSCISWHQPLQKIFTSVFLIISFSGNGLLAGLRMKRPSVYIDQWSEENAQWHLVEDIKVQSQRNDDSQ